ncbi:locomotion-related protein Hikaru genki [Tetranychus urticae]|uniref:locomotion-related protein Hikaru genki n=1 Tax=Tetranychus urticae TaxID=32264 RepID=UPI00077C02ED|nr:locomotion-related protein Hikaru genki [Tetranychus urticae]
MNISFETILTLLFKVKLIILLIVYVSCDGDKPLPIVGTPCASPEVLVNGSPSPDILDMVTGGKSSSFTSIEEILFVGQLNPSDEKRICKIKCMKGVWVGPMCSSKPGSDVFEHPTFKECQLKPRSNELVITHNVSQIVLDQVQTFTDQSIIKVRCNDVGLYKFNGFSELQCIKGIWDHPLPKCEETTMHTNFSLDSPPSIVYSVTSGDIGITDSGELLVTPGTVLHLDCLFSRTNGDPEWTWTMAQRQYPTGWAVSEDSRNWKYRLSVYYTNEKDSGQFKCTTPKGHFNSISIKVKDIECPPIDSSDPNRIMIVDGRKMHSQARFSCVEGYFLVGFDDIVCTPNGYWSHPLPNCQAIECPPLSTEDPYLKMSTYNRTFGSRVYFSCPNGYRLNGLSSISCFKNNTWSNEIPQCEENTCPIPSTPSNGRLLDIGHYRTGDYVQYFCNSGYIMIGDGLSICLENGTWSKPTPICKASCEFPGEPTNGYLIPTKFHYNIGETISIVCKPDYRLQGSTILTCNSDGHWSVPLPFCKPAYPVI